MQSCSTENSYAISSEDLSETQEIENLIMALRVGRAPWNTLNLL